MKNFWLSCTKCFSKFPFELKGKCACGGTFVVEYDLEQAAHAFHKDPLPKRDPSMWRYHELLPVKDRDCIVTLGEGGTPLLRLPRLERKLPLKRLLLKREEQNPTGSFKARGFSAAISLLKERGVDKVSVPSNGNAASALAAYAARAGMTAYVFIPADCPPLIVEECFHYGAHTYQVDGMIHDAARLVEEGEKRQGWFNVGTLREPGRAEGKKTMGLELAEQLGWTAPDVIIYPTGGGSGIIGLWRAFLTLREMGWIKGELPRLVSVQESGCQPIVDAFKRVSEVVPCGGEVRAMPTGLRVPQPPDGDLIVSILRETGGTAVAVESDEIVAAQRMLGLQGVSSSPEGAATWAGLVRLCDQGWIGKNDTVVLFNTSHAMKYLSSDYKPRVPVVRDYANWQHLFV